MATRQVPVNTKGKAGILRKGEQQRPNGSYAFRWSDEMGVRHTIYAATLDDLRNKEKEIERDRQNRIKPEARTFTINDMFTRWTQTKRGLRDNTFQNYKYMYNMFVAPRFGKRRISTLVKSDIKQFYNSLQDDCYLAVTTIDGVHTVLHQVLQMAVDDCYIPRNPADNVMRELKRTADIMQEKRRALTQSEQRMFLDYLRNTPKYQHWYPVFATLVGTGLRVGEAIGLRWCDIDFDHGMIDVNHTLIYYKHETNGCYCNVHTPKTMNGIRKVPILAFVREALLMERKYQEDNGIHCIQTIDGYTDFVFVNRFGMSQHQGTLNKALRRILRDYNGTVLLLNKPEEMLLPHFSCHSLRHTFATRMCEAGVNIKVIQDTLGHADVSTTLNIYTDATTDLKRQEFDNLDDFWNNMNL